MLAANGSPSDTLAIIVVFTIFECKKKIVEKNERKDKS
jgi:hypothetical protein